VNSEARQTGRRPAVDAQISPRGSLELLSQKEVEILRARSDTALLDTFRRCAWRC